MFPWPWRFPVICLLVIVQSGSALAACSRCRVEATNSIGMRLVEIPRGEFWMGAQESRESLHRAFPGFEISDRNAGDEYPRHRVRITRPIFLGKYEVTVGQFRRFLRETNTRSETERDGTGGWGYNRETQMNEGRDKKYDWKNPGYPQTEEHPVVNVTWNDAVEFCRWLSRREGRTYRLPTEAEWEYACRAGTTTRYSTGDDPKTLVGSSQEFHVLDPSQFGHVQELKIPPDSDRFPLRVGSLKPNPFGLHDMHGNVWEWCSDWYNKDYYSASPLTDPTGPQTAKQRVRRGGGWNSFPLWSRASFRNWNRPDSRCVNLGFRVAREE